MTSAKPTGMMRAMVVLTAACLMAGCASRPEQALRSRYIESDEVFRTAAPAHSVSLDEKSTFDDYMQLAFARNPMLRADFYRWKAAMERIPQARSLDDPELTFEYFTQQTAGRYQASLKQMFPLFGKLELRERRAVAEAESAMYAFETSRFDLYERLVKAFYEYQYLARATAVSEETFQLLTELEAVVTARYQTSQTPFSGLIKVQSEKDRVETELAAMRDERVAQSAMLSALLNIPVGTVLPWPDAVSSGPALIDEAVLAGMIAQLNPELQAADAMVDAERYGQQLARRGFTPDLMVGANYMVMPGMDGMGDESDVGLMAGISVPLWAGRRFAEIREAEAGVRAAEDEKAGMYNRLRAELSMEVFKYRDAERKLSLYTTSLIPKAEQALEAARREFSSGQSDFMMLIDAQRMLLDARLMEARAAADREIAMGMIGCCVGKFDIREMADFEMKGTAQ